MLKRFSVIKVKPGLIHLPQLLLSLSFSLKYPISYTVTSVWIRQEQQLLQDYHRWWLWQTSGKAAKVRAVSALLTYLESSRDEIIWCSVLLSKVLRTLWETDGG